MVVVVVSRPRRRLVVILVFLVGVHILVGAGFSSHGFGIRARSFRCRCPEPMNFSLEHYILNPKTLNPSL